VARCPLEGDRAESLNNTWDECSKCNRTGCDVVRTRSTGAVLGEIKVDAIASEVTEVGVSEGMRPREGVGGVEGEEIGVGGVGMAVGVGVGVGIGEEVEAISTVGRITPRGLVDVATIGGALVFGIET
jgi:hypothetical protein